MPDPITHLPPELLTQILFPLPPLQLIHLRLVSHSWCEFLSPDSPLLARIHTTHPLPSTAKSLDSRLRRRVNLLNLTHGTIVSSIHPWRVSDVFTSSTHLVVAFLGRPAPQFPVLGPRAQEIARESSMRFDIYPLRDSTSEKQTIYLADHLPRPLLTSFAASRGHFETPWITLTPTTLLIPLLSRQTGQRTTLLFSLSPLSLLQRWDHTPTSPTSYYVKSITYNPLISPSTTTLAILAAETSTAAITLTTFSTTTGDPILRHIYPPTTQFVATSAPGSPLAIDDSDTIFAVLSESDAVPFIDVFKPSGARLRVRVQHTIFPVLEPGRSRHLNILTHNGAVYLEGLTISRPQRWRARDKPTVERKYARLELWRCRSHVNEDGIEEVDMPETRVLHVGYEKMEVESPTVPVPGAWGVITQAVRNEERGSARVGLVGEEGLEWVQLGGGWKVRGGDDGFLLLRGVGPWVGEWAVVALEGMVPEGVGERKELRGVKKGEVVGGGVGTVG